MKSDPGEYSASRNPPASPTSVQRSGEKKRVDPYEKSWTRRKSRTSSRRPSISACSCGSLRFIQSMNASKLEISSHGWKRASAHTPIEIGPDSSWISHSQ